MKRGMKRVKKGKFIWALLLVFILSLTITPAVQGAEVKALTLEKLSELDENGVRGYEKLTIKEYGAALENLSEDELQRFRDVQEFDQTFRREESIFREITDEEMNYTLDELLALDENGIRSYEKLDIRELGEVFQKLIKKQDELQIFISVTVFDRIFRGQEPENKAIAEVLLTDPQILEILKAKETSLEKLVTQGKLQIGLWFEPEIKFEIIIDEESLFFKFSPEIERKLEEMWLEAERESRAYKQRAQEEMLEAGIKLQGNPDTAIVINVERPVADDQTDMIKVIIDDKLLTFEMPPQIVNDRLLVPLRAIFEEMGAMVKWEENTQTVIATKDNAVVVLTIGDSYPTINGQIIPLDQPGIIVEGRALAPLRFVAEAFGGTVFWDSTNNTAIIWQ